MLNTICSAVLPSFSDWEAHGKHAQKTLSVILLEGIRLALRYAVRVLGYASI
jgi:hypothetical protein